MKKFLAFLGIIVLLALVFILVSGLFISREYHFERSISIRAPQEEIWKNISLFSNFEKWDPAKARDSTMRRTITGTDGTVGATYAWEGNKEVGSGSQTFKTIHPFEHITIDLQCSKPFAFKAAVFYHLVPEGKATKITWGFDSKITYPFNAVSYFFMDRDARMDQVFAAGLANLKKLCESSATMTALNDTRAAKGRSQVPAQFSEVPVER